MKYIFFVLALIIQFSSVAQKELKGEWDLQFMGTSEKPLFDINDPTILMDIPGQSGMKVNFETEDDSLNKELSVTSHDIFNNCWLLIKNKKKFKKNDLTIANGVFINEEFNGNCSIFPDKKEVIFESISSTSKKVIFTAHYTYKIEGNILTLTSVENPEARTIYKRRG